MSVGCSSSSQSQRTYRLHRRVCAPCFSASILCRISVSRRRRPSGRLEQVCCRSHRSVMRAESLCHQHHPQGAANSSCRCTRLWPYESGFCGRICETHHVDRRCRMRRPPLRHGLAIARRWKFDTVNPTPPVDDHGRSPDIARSDRQLFIAVAGGAESAAGASDFWPHALSIADGTIPP